MGLRADEEVRFARGRARKSPGCVVDHRRNDWASHSPHGESELSRLSSKRWLGRTEFLTATIASEPSIGKRKPSARAKWRSSPSAGSCVPITYLTEPTLLEMAIFSPVMSGALRSGAGTICRIDPAAARFQAKQKMLQHAQMC